MDESDKIQKMAVCENYEITANDAKSEEGGSQGRSHPWLAKMTKKAVLTIKFLIYKPKNKDTVVRNLISRSK